MDTRFFRLAVAVLFFSFAISGCAYFSAQKDIKAAEKSLLDLKAAGGEKLVPYEYCSAESFLEISKFTFKENSFKTTRGFAGRSKSASEAGLAEIQKKK